MASVLITGASKGTGHLAMRAVPDEAITEIVDDVWLPLLRAQGPRPAEWPGG